MCLIALFESRKQNFIIICCSITRQSTFAALDTPVMIPIHIYQPILLSNVDGAAIGHFLALVQIRHLRSNLCDRICIVCGTTVFTRWSVPSSQQLACNQVLCHHLDNTYFASPIRTKLSWNTAAITSWLSVHAFDFFLGHGSKSAKPGFAFIQS